MLACSPTGIPLALQHLYLPTHLHCLISKRMVYLVLFVACRILSAHTKRAASERKSSPYPIQSCENMYTEQARTVVLTIVCVASVTTSASGLEQPPCTKCLLAPSSAQQPCRTTGNRLIGHGGAETMLSHDYKTHILSSSLADGRI